MNTNTSLTWSADLVTYWENIAYEIGYLLTEPGFPLHKAIEGFQFGECVNRTAQEIVKTLPDVEDIAGSTEAPIPGSSESTVRESEASSPEQNSTLPSSPSVLSNPATPATPAAATDASDVSANEEEGRNGLVMDMETKSPGSPGCSVTQVAIPSEPAPPYIIDLTGEDEPSDGIPASKPKNDGRLKRKYGHENWYSEHLSLSQARKRSRAERKLEEDELRLRAKEIVWERGQERSHQTAYRDGHKWSSEEFLQDPECIIEMEVIVNNGNNQTLWLSKTGQTDGQGMVWEGDDALGIYKVSLTSKDIESMVGKDYVTVIKKYKYIERDI